jgi:hypothetical protein
LDGDVAAESGAHQYVAEGELWYLPRPGGKDDDDGGDGGEEEADGGDRTRLDALHHQPSDRL